MRKTFLVLLALAQMILLSACAQYQNKRGVDVTWQSTVTDSLVKGQATRSDVLELLGPPSQVISLEDETVFYYLFEHSDGDGVILVVYNRFSITTGYDRAIFFFDESGKLTDYATHVRQ